MKNEMTRKWISCLICLAMLLTLVPINAFAASNHSYTIGFVDENGNLRTPDEIHREVLSFL